MKKLGFSIGERVRMIAILNEFKGNLDTLSAIIEDVKNIKITDKEWEKAEMKRESIKDEKGNDAEQMTWNDEKGGLKEIELQKETLKFLQENIKKKDEAGEITLQDVVLVSLYEKLK